MSDLRDGEQDLQTSGEPKTEINPATLTDDQRTGVALMQEVCNATGQISRPVVRNVSGAYLYIELEGDDIRQTWGRMGQSLDALQFLCNLILSRRIRSDVRMMLDADNYRERRAETLRQKAVELAEEVKSRREEAELEPLPAHERRIIHSILADDPDIETYSEGDEPNRRVVIAPGKSA